MKNSSKNAKIVILTFVIFISTLTYFAWTSFSLQNFSQNTSETLLSIPEINVPVLSEDNNTYHDVNIEFFLQVNPDDVSSLDIEQLEAEITSIVESMNYDDLVSTGNMDHLKSNIIENLNINNDVEILNIYISDISTS